MYHLTNYRMSKADWIFTRYFNWPVIRGDFLPNPPPIFFGLLLDFSYKLNIGFLIQTEHWISHTSWTFDSSCKLNNISEIKVWKYLLYRFQVTVTNMLRFDYQIIFQYSNRFQLWVNSILVIPIFCVWSWSLPRSSSLKANTFKNTCLGDFEGSA